MKQTPYTEALSNYADTISLREHPSLEALRKTTSHLQLAAMQTPPSQAQFLQFLIRATRAKRVLELGTYTGYGTLAMALALPSDGKIVTCDINPNWTQHAYPFWESAQQSHKIDLRLAPALDTLKILAQEPPFDFIYIDADKTHYVDYYHHSLQCMHPEGLIAIDNIFWDGKVIDTDDNHAQTREIRRLNQRIKEDQTVEVSLLPIGDGLFLIQKKRETSCC